MNDVLYFASAAEVINRSGDTLKDRTYGISTAETLYELVADISCLQIREYEYVGFSGNGAARRFGLGNALYKGCVCLQFSVELKFGSHLFSQLGGLCYFVNELMFGTALGREGQHSYSRFDACNGFCGLCRRDSNLCQLFCIRIRVHGTIGEEEEPVLAELFGRSEHEERTAHDRAARFGFQNLERRTDGICRRTAGTGQLTVSITGFDHQTAEVQRILCFLGGLFLRHSFRLAKLKQQFGVLRHLRIMDRIYDLSLMDVLIALLSSHAFDFLGIADQNQVSDFVS